MKICLVGMGNMGRNHYRILHQLGAEIVVCDPNRNVISGLPHAITHYSSLSDALLKETLDAVDICAPTSFHYDLTTQVLKYNLPVFVEKPLAANSLDATKLLDLSKKSGASIFPGHIERFNPVVNALKKELSDKETVHLQFTRVGPRPPQIVDAGVILDIGIHDIDLAAYLTGQEVVSVTCASLKQNALDDAAQLLLRLSGGASAIITVNRHTPFKAREINAVTKQKLYRADLILGSLTSYFDYIHTPKPSFRVENLAVQGTEPLLLELQSFIECIKQDKPAPFGADFAATAVRVVEAALKSSALKQEVAI